MLTYQLILTSDAVVCTWRRPLALANVGRGGLMREVL